MSQTIVSQTLEQINQKSLDLFVEWSKIEPSLCWMPEEDTTASTYCIRSSIKNPLYQLKLNIPVLSDRSWGDIQLVVSYLALRRGLNVELSIQNYDPDIYIVYLKRGGQAISWGATSKFLGFSLLDAYCRYIWCRSKNPQF